MASGQDGQFLNWTAVAKFLLPIGNGMGIGPGQFIEASYLVLRQGRQHNCGRYQCRTGHRDTHSTLAIRKFLAASQMIVSDFVVG